MKFKSVLALCAALALAAQAQIGVGYDKSLAGVGGLSGKYVTGDFLIQLILDWESNNVAAIAIAPRGFYRVINQGPLTAYAGLGINYTTCQNIASYDLNNGACYEEPATPIPGAPDPYNPLSIEIPFMLDLKIHPMLSLHTGLGIKWGLTADFETNKGIKGDLIGNAGFTLWFGDASPSKKPAKKKKAKKVVDETPAPAPAPVAEEEEEEEEEEE